MARVEEAQTILAALGLPPAQQTRIAAYTLLAMCDLGTSGPWSEARRRSIRIHDILGFIKKEFGRLYAENTRETIRRQVLHQLEQARVVDRNPDEPVLATNSPRTHYALTGDALRVIRSFGATRFRRESGHFLERHGSLAEAYRAAKARRMIPLPLPSGREAALSPGRHNQLQVSVITEFKAHFAPDAALLYVGDTANKTLILESEVLEELGVSVSKHDKLPDVVMHSAEKNRLYLVEAVTSHGPVSAKRLRELEVMLRRCSATRVYVSAFLDMKEFKRHVDNIAWETQVWIADLPNHLIHFDGERFVG